MANGDLATLKASYEAAKKDFDFWTTGNKCEPGSVKWEESVAKYNAAKDAYDFALREAGTRPSARKNRSRTGFTTALRSYTTQGPVGQGGTGIVYEVKDEADRPYAIKCITQSALTSQRRKRFRNEIEFCSKNYHPNVISVIDWGLVPAEIEEDEIPFYVMPLYATTLRGLMDKGLKHDEILPLFAQVLSGLRAAHELGVYHRDLKPENILIDTDTGHAVIADFGIAHFAESLLQAQVDTAPGERLANFQYAAPEQRTRGEVDQRADVYALGLILNEMFTGQLLQGTGHKTIQSVAPDHAFLDELVDKMVRQSPAERPQSIEAIQTVLGITTDVPAVAAERTGSAEIATSATSKDGSPSMADAPQSQEEVANGEVPRPNQKEGPFQRLKLYVLDSADKRFPEYANFRTDMLGREFGLKEGFVNQFLEGLHREGLIELSAWDGQRVLPIDQWPSTNEFFQSSADGGYKRVKLSWQGKDFLEQNRP